MSGRIWIISLTSFWFLLCEHGYPYNAYIVKQFCKSNNEYVYIVYQTTCLSKGLVKHQSINQKVLILQKWQQWLITVCFEIHQNIIMISMMMMNSVNKIWEFNIIDLIVFVNFKQQIITAISKITNKIQVQIIFLSFQNWRYSRWVKTTLCKTQEMGNHVIGIMVHLECVVARGVEL